MIPQIIVVIWLTLAWVAFAKQLTRLEGFANEVDSAIISFILIAIVAVALYFGNFWCVT